MMISYHPLDIQVFNGNKTIVVHQCAGKLMMNVGASVADFTMKIRNCFARLVPISGTLLSCGQTALFPFEPFFRFPQVPGVFDHGPIGKNGKGFDADIHADGGVGNRSGCWRDFCREAGEPLVSISPHGAGLHGPDNLPMKPYFHSSDLGEPKTMRSPLRYELETRFLRVAKGVVVAFTFVARIAGFAVSLPDSTKKGLKSSIYPEKDVLKYLRMDIVKYGYSLLVGLQNLLLSYAGKTFTGRLVMITPVGKTGVIENPADLERLLKDAGLFLCRVKAVFVSANHCLSNITELMFTIKGNLL